MCNGGCGNCPGRGQEPRTNTEEVQTEIRELARVRAHIIQGLVAALNLDAVAGGFAPESLKDMGPDRAKEVEDIADAVMVRIWLGIESHDHG